MRRLVSALVVSVLVVSALLGSQFAEAAPTLTATAVCSPAPTRAFTLSGSGFPANTFLGIRVERADGSVFFHSGVTSDAAGSFGGPGLYGTGTETGTLTVRVLDRSSLDPAAVQLAVTSLTPCPVPTLEQRLADLANLINGFDLHPGTANGLVAKVQAAQASLARGNTTAACNQLQALINAAQAQSGKKLTPAQASAITTNAQGVRSALACR